MLQHMQRNTNVSGYGGGGVSGMGTVGTDAARYQVSQPAQSQSGAGIGHRWGPRDLLVRPPPASSQAWPHSQTKVSY